MIKTGDKERAVRLDDDFVDVLAMATEPPSDSHRPGHDRLVALSRWVDRLPSLFNVEIEDINALPPADRDAVLRELHAYMTATREKATPSSADRMAASLDAVRKLVDGFRARILAPLKSAELKGAMRNPDLKPRTSEFTADRFAKSYGMNLVEMDAVAAAQPELVGAVDEAMAAHVTYSGSERVRVNLPARELVYGNLYRIDMRTAFRRLESAMVAAGLLTKPMLEIIRKAGGDRIRSLILEERAMTTPHIARGLQGKEAAETAAFYAAMEAYLQSGRVTGDAAKAFDNEALRLELSA